MTRIAPVYRWLSGADGKPRAQRVGDLKQADGRWEFIYAHEYLALEAAAWELDPSTIRTKGRGGFPYIGSVPHPVFCDVALSGWSHLTLEKHRDELLGVAASAQPWGWWERLVYAPADGFGALFVGEHEAKPKSEAVLAEALGEITSESLAAILEDSSSGAMGGERPKIAARANDGDSQVPVIIKFALPNERKDNVIAEATALSLAVELGLRVPKHKVIPIGDVYALQVERFDRDAQGSAFHCVSAATALNLPPMSDPEEPKRNYVRLRSLLREPEDALELFSRVVLNGAVGNNDDHPWNTSLMQTGLRTWRLSPLYDVQPFHARRAGTPAFRMAISKNGTRLGSRENLIAAGKQIGGLKTDEQCEEVIDRIDRHVRSRWRALFEHHSSSVDANAGDWIDVFEPKQAPL